MRRTALLSLVAVLVSLGGTPTAQADTPRCVSRYEYNRVVNGMTMTRVHHIFDIEGSATGLGLPNLVRHYKPCTRNGLVQVTYSPQGRVIDKSAQWL
jgi:hypothetical protein